MRRHKIATLMTVVLYLAISLGALLNPHDWRIWESTMFSLTAFLFATSTVMAFVRRGPERMAWAGFAVFGWAYTLLGFEAWSFAPRPTLLTTFILKEILESARDRFGHGVEMRTFSGFGHAYFAVFCGLIGAGLGYSLAGRDLSEPGSRGDDATLPPQ